jgi:hypothetical protein
MFESAHGVPRVPHSSCHRVSLVRESASLIFSSMDSTRVPPESGKDQERLQQLREDISRRLRHLVSDWPQEEQAAIIEKIAQTELRFPPEPFVKEFESMRKTDRG